MADEILGLDEVLAQPETAASQESPEGEQILGLDEVLAEQPKVLGWATGEVATEPSSPEDVAAQERAEAGPAPAASVAPTARVDTSRPGALQQFLERPIAEQVGETDPMRFDVIPDRERSAQLLSWMVSTSKITPEKARDVAQVAAVHRGMDPEYIAEHLDELKQDISQEQLKAALASSPRLASFVAMPEKAIHTAKVRDQLTKMSWIERWITGSGPTHPGLKAGPEADAARAAYEAAVARGEVSVAPIWAQAFAKGMYDQDLNNLGREIKKKVEAGEPLTEDDEYRIGYLLTNAPEPDFTQENVLTRAVAGTFEMAPGMALSVAVDQSVLAVTRAIAGAHPAGRVAMILAPVTGQVLLQKQQTDGMLFLQARSMTDDQGRRLFSDAEAASLADGVAWTQAVATGPLQHVVASGLVSGGLRKAAVEAALEKAQKATVATAVKAFSQNQAAGLSNIFLQSLITDGGLQVAEAQRTGKPVDAARIFKNAAKATLDFAPTSVLMGAVSARGHILEALGKEHLNWEEAARRQVLADAIAANPAFKPEEGSPTVKVDPNLMWEAGNIPTAPNADVQLGPDSAVEVMQHLAQGEVVYVDRGAFERAAADRRLRPEELAAAIYGDGGAAYHAAVEAKADDLPVPAGQFYGRLGGTELFTALRDDIRLSQKTETTRQSRTRKAREDADFEKLRSLKLEEMTPDQRRVYDDYFEKGLAAGDREAAEANARVMAAVARSWSEQMKKAGTADLDAWQVYQDNQVVRVFGPDGRTSEQVAKSREAPPPVHPGDIPHYVATYQKLKERPVAPGEAPAHAQLYYRDATTRLLGERGLRDIEPTPEKPNFGVITFGFKKDINDVLGHDRADDGFRSIGRALHAEDPLAAKLGGDFALPRFGTQEEMNALVARLQSQFPGVPIIGTVAPRVAGEKWVATKHRLGDAIQAHANKLRGEGKYPSREERLPKTADLSKFTEERVTDHTLPAELVSKHSTLTDEQARREVFVELETGAKTKAGWDEIRRAKPREFVLAMDARAISAMDKTFGHRVTDGMIGMITTRAMELGGEKYDFAHVSGDEFKAHGDNEAELKAFLEKLKVSLANEMLYIEAADGKLLEQQGLFVEGGTAGGPHAERDADAHALPDAKKRANLERGDGDEERGKQWYAGRSRAFLPGTPEHAAALSRREDRGRVRTGREAVEPVEVAAEVRGGRRVLDPAEFVGVLNESRRLAEVERQLRDAGRSFVRVDNGDGTSDFALVDDTPSMEARARAATSPEPEVQRAISNKGVPVEASGNVKGGEVVETLVLKQTRNLAEWFDTFSRNKKVRETYKPEDLASLRAALETSRMIFQRNESLLPTENENASPLQSNQDYGYSLDFTTICPRQDAYVAHIVGVERTIGRLLKPEERFLLGKMMEEQSLQPNCWYCYGSAGRNKYDRTVGSLQDVMTRYVQLMRDTDGKATPAQLDETFSREGEYKFTARGSKLRKYLDQNWAELAKHGVPDAVALRDLARGYRKAADDIEGTLASAAHIIASNATKANDPKPWASIKQQLLKMPPEKVATINARAGLRMNSQTDFRPWQAIELSEAVASAFANGLKMHDFTKETAILKAFGKTGIKFNLSAAYELDAAGHLKLDERGLPKFSSVDGMAGPDIEFWVKELPRDAGGMLVAVNDEALLAGLADPRVHMVIPYHQGPIPKTVNEMAHARDYTYFQHEHGWGETRKLTGWGDSRPIPKLGKDGKPVIDPKSGQPVTMREYLRHGKWVPEGTPETVKLKDGREFTVKVGAVLNPKHYDTPETHRALHEALGITFIRKPKVEVFRRGQWVPKEEPGQAGYIERVTLQSGRVVEVPVGVSLNASHHKSNLADYFDLCNQLGLTPKFADLTLTKPDGTVVPVAQKGPDGKWDPARAIPGYMKMIVDVAREPNDQAVPDPRKIDFEALYKIQEEWIAKGGENLDEAGGGEMPLVKVSPETVEMLANRVRRGEWPSTTTEILPEQLARAQEQARQADRIAAFGPLEKGEVEVPAKGDLSDLKDGRLTAEAPAPHMLYQPGFDTTLTAVDLVELRDLAQTDPAVVKEYLDAAEDVGIPRAKAERALRYDAQLMEAGLDAGMVRDSSARALKDDPRFAKVAQQNPGARWAAHFVQRAERAIELMRPALQSVQKKLHAVDESTLFPALRKAKILSSRNAPVVEFDPTGEAGAGIARVERDAQRDRLVITRADGVVVPNVSRVDVAAQLGIYEEWSKALGSPHTTAIEDIGRTLRMLPEQPEGRMDPREALWGAGQAIRTLLDVTNDEAASTIEDALATVGFRTGLRPTEHEDGGLVLTKVPVTDTDTRIFPELAGMTAVEFGFERGRGLTSSGVVQSVTPLQDGVPGPRPVQEPGFEGTHQLFQKGAGPRWYSRASEAVQEAKQRKGTADSWLAIVSKAPGVRAEELEFLGLREWLTAQGKAVVTKEQVAEFINANTLPLTEKLLGDPRAEEPPQVARYRERLQDAKNDLESYNVVVDDAVRQFKDDEKYAIKFAREAVEALKVGDIATAKSKAEMSANMLDNQSMDVLNRSAHWYNFKEAVRGMEFDDAEFRADGVREAQVYIDEYNEYDPWADPLFRQEVESTRDRLAHDVDRAEEMLEHVKKDSPVAAHYEAYTLGGHTPGSYRELLVYTPKAAGFESAHFGEHGAGGEAGGMLAHARVSEHTVGGERTLMVEEIQSDLHQAGRDAGYFPAETLSDGREGAPEGAPLKTGWEEFLVKRMLRYAVENGYSRIAWTTGEQQADRYDLRKQVDEIVYDRVTQRLSAGREGRLMMQQIAKPEELPGIVGHAVAKKLLASEHTYTTVEREPGVWVVQDETGRFQDRDVFSDKARADEAREEYMSALAPYNRVAGDDLTVGGEGMKVAYDKRIPGHFEKWLKKYGGSVTKMETETDAGTQQVWAADIPEGLRDVAEAKGFPLFSKAKGGDRGYISFTPARGAERRRFDIHVLESGDRSTLAHETFHFLSEVFGDLVDRKQASPQMAADYQTLLRFMGYEDHAGRVAAAEERQQLASKEKLTAAESRRLKDLMAREERSTHAWEQFLFEGKAPDPALVRTFAKFSRWLTGIYRSVIAGRVTGRADSPAEQFEVQYGQPLQLSDAVREVFGRMLSADAAATKALGEPEHTPIPAVAAALPADQREEYLKRKEAARAAATTTLVRRAAEARRKENQGWAKEQKERLAETVRQDLESQPGYRAAAVLRDGSPLVDIRLDRKEVAKVYGPVLAKQLERQHPGVYNKDRPGPAVGPDDAAKALGLQDGDALVHALTSAENLDAATRKEVERRFRETYGPALEDHGAALADAALDAVHDERHLVDVVTELHALARLVDKDLAKGDPRASLEASKRMADRVLAGKSVAEVHPDHFLSLERQAARKAFEAAERGDLKEAYAQKQVQAHQATLYRAARDLEEKLASGYARLKKTRSADWRGYLGKALGVDPVTGEADTTLREAHDAILAGLGLAPDEQSARADGVAALDRLGEVFAREFQVPDFDLGALREAVRSRTPWDQLTTADAQNVLDAVTHLRTLAKSATEMDLGRERRSMDAVARDVVTRLEASQAIMKPAARDVALESWTRKVGDGFRYFEGMQLTADTWAQLVDGGPEGPFRDAVYRPWRDAVARADDLNKRYTKAFMDAVEALPKELQDRSTEIIEGADKAIPIPMKLRQKGLGDGQVTRSYLWMIALNLGNEGNKQRLLDGYEWNEPQVLSFLAQHLSKAEWDFVQKTWDSLDSLRPELEKVHRADTGLPLKLVKAAPFRVRTADGQTVELRGGYWPLVYSKFNERGAKNEAIQDAKSVADMFDTRYVRGTDTGATKERVQHFVGALNLSWDVAPRHVEQVVHDIAFRRFIKQTAKLLLRPDVDTALKTRLGEARTQMILPWLQSIANRRADSLPANLAPVQRFLGWMKGRAALNALGYVVSVPMGDFANPGAVVARGEVGAKQMSSSVLKVFSSAETREFCLSNSPELRHQIERVQQRLNDQFARVAAKKPNKALQAVRRGAFAMMEMTTYLTSIPIWHAKYEQEVKRLVAEGDTDAHARAVALADDTVQRNFPPTDPTEGPQMMRRKDWLGSMLMFVGYVNRLGNAYRVMFDQAARAVRGPGDTGERVRDVARVAGHAAAFALVTGVAGEWLSGRGREEDESTESWLLRKWALAPVQASLPLIGSAIDPVVLGRKASVRQAPGISVAESTVSLASKLIDVAQGEQDPDSKLVWDLLEQVGFWAGIPGVRQAKRVAEGVEGARGGSAANVVRTAGGVVYGEKERPSTNPATDLADVLE